MENATPTFLEKLANIGSEEINIPKDKKAYGYNYAPLETILPIIEPLMKKHGLWYFHTNDFDKSIWKNVLTTTIYEVEPYQLDGKPFIGSINSKTLIDDEVILAKMNKYMVIGSAITYFRRYHLVSMLGLLTDEDTDAGGVPGGGRSVEAKAPKTNLVDSFKKTLPNRKSKADAMKLFNTHQHNFTEKQKEEVLKLIDETYESK